MQNKIQKIPLRTKKKLQAEYNITHSALQLFEQRGYNAVSIDDIAEAADISKGTFYNYFPTKEAVLLKICQKSINMVKETLSKAPHSENPIEMIKLCFYYLIDDTYMWRNVAREIAVINVSNESTHDLLDTLIVNYVKEAQEKGIFRNDYDHNMITRSLIGIYYVALFELNSSTSREEYMKQLEISYTFILEGILNHGN